MKAIIFVLCLLIAKSIAYNPLECDYTYAAQTGLVRSPYFPSNYPIYTECRWLIITSSRTAIRLDFTNFVTDAWDFVRIYDGPTPSSPLLLSHSGATLPDIVVSSENAMLIIFTSDGSVGFSGFSAQYTAIIPGIPTTSSTTAVPTTTAPTCGGTMFGSDYILSPNYPSSYFNNLDCTWYLQSNAAQTIAARFELFDTESKADLVTVIEGWDPLTGTVMLDKASGVLDPFIIESSRSNRMMIRFTSDDSVTSSGFRMYFADAVNATTTITSTTSTTSTTTATIEY